MNFYCIFELTNPPENLQSNKHFIASNMWFLNTKKVKFSIPINFEDEEFIKDMLLKHANPPESWKIYDINILNKTGNFLIMIFFTCCLFILLFLYLYIA